MSKVIRALCIDEKKDAEELHHRSKVRRRKMQVAKELAETAAVLEEYIASQIASEITIQRESIGFNHFVELLTKQCLTCSKSLLNILQGKSFEEKKNDTPE